MNKFVETTYPNSRKVTIYRNSTFIADAQAATVPEYQAMANKGVGPYFASSDSQQMGTGLTTQEVKLLMPIILEIDGEEKTFRQEVSKYFQNLRTEIPFEGREFETGLEKDNSAVVSEKNMPLDTVDYVRFKHAVKFPYTAKDRATAAGNQVYWFYVSDPVAEKEASRAISELKDRAMGIYIALKTDAEKVDAYLTLLGKDPRREADRQLTLRNLAETQPKKFVEVHDIDNFEWRYLIKTLININVLRLMNGYQVIDVETNKIVGQTIEEAIMEIQKPEYDNIISVWKQKKQEALKKNLVSRQKRIPTTTRQ